MLVHKYMYQFLSSRQKKLWRNDGGYGYILNILPYIYFFILS